MKEHWTDDFFDEKFGRVIGARDPETTLKQVDFVIEKTGISGGASVLDVCCGFGRHSLELARRGFQVVGIDLFDSYLAQPRRVAAQEGLPVDFISMDIRELSFERQFDLAINMWTSFGFFDEATNASIIRKVRDCLRCGGKFVIELVNRDWLVKNFQPRGWWQVDEGLIVIEERSLDLANSIVSSTWRFLEDGKLHERPMQLRVYACHEMFRLLERSGFSEIAAFGDLQGGLVSFDSRMMLILATAC